MHPRGCAMTKKILVHSLNSQSYMHLQDKLRHFFLKKNKQKKKKLGIFPRADASVTDHQFQKFKWL